MYKKKLLFIFLFFVLGFKTVMADNKVKIIQELNNTQSFKFDFNQNIKGVLEKGECIIIFPKKLKCEYKNQKKIILKENTLAIVQERYGKVQYYPVSKSPFTKILDKVELIKLIKLGNITELENQFQLTNSLQINDISKVSIFLLSSVRTSLIIPWGLRSEILAAIFSFSYCFIDAL